MQSIKIYLCDDEPKILSDLSKKVKTCIPDSIIQSFPSGAALLEGLQNEPCDILLLDIDMPDINGMDIRYFEADGNYLKLFYSKANIVFAAL